MKRYQKYDRTIDDVLAKGHLLERFTMLGLVMATIVGVGVFAVSLERSKNTSRVSIANMAPSSNEESGMQLASQFLSDQDYGAAIATYDKILSDDANQAAALVGRGIAKGHQGAYESAVKDFSAARLIADWSEAIPLNLGCLYTAIGDVEQAENSYMLAINANVDSVTGYANRARCYFDQGQFKAAMADLSEAIRLAPEDPVLRANRAIVLVKTGHNELAAADMAVAANFGESERYELLLALFQLEAGMATDCLATTKRVLEANPDAEEFQFLAGAAIDRLSVMKDADTQVWNETLREAVRAFRLSPDRLNHVRQTCQEFKNRFIAEGYCAASFVALEPSRVVPRDPTAFAAKEAYGQAVQYASGGDLHTAIAFLNEALRNDPDNERSRQFRTMLLIGTAQLSEAEYALSELTRDYPDDEEFQTLLAMVHSRQGEYQSSLEALNHAVRIQSNNPVVFANRAMVRFVAKDDFAAVVKDCERAERLGLRTAKQFDLHAQAAAKLSDFEAANRYHQKAIEIDPANGEWLCSQCETFLSQGKLADAMTSAEQAFLLMPDDGRAMLLHATCLYQQNDFRGAMQAVQRAKTIGVYGASGDVLHARLLFKQRNYSAASNLLISVITEESSANEQAFRAECHFREQDYESAWQWIHAAINKDAEEGESAEDKKKLLLASMIEEGRGNAKAAYDLLCASLSGDSLSQSESLKLAVAAQEAGLWKESLSWLGKLVDQKEQSPDAWHYAGVAFEKIDQPINALKCYSHVISAQEDSVKSRLGRARVLVSLQRYREAVRDLNELENSGVDSAELKRLRSACQLLSVSRK